mmetsp:Transcript_45427/g.176627  ORF Transcript_45427/g.176627 Transcript_45427/m.176627 type:complete len:86 (+) Transcript_45427:8287-8544(+)
MKRLLELLQFRLRLFSLSLVRGGSATEFLDHDEAEELMLVFELNHNFENVVNPWFQKFVSEYNLNRSTVCSRPKGRRLKPSLPSR